MQKFKHKLIGMAAVLLLAGCGYIGLGRNNAAAVRTATLGKQTIAANVSATGNVAPENETRLSFQVQGTVAEVKVKNGDKVKKGDVIASLDLTDLNIAYQQAEVGSEQADIAIANAETALINAGSGIIIAQAGYSRTVEGSRWSDIVAAQAALNAANASYARATDQGLKSADLKSAQAAQTAAAAALSSAQENYNKVKEGPTSQDVASAQAVLQNAEAAAKQAQFAYDNALRRDPAGIGASPAALQLEQATNNLKNARAQYEKASKPADSAQLQSALQQIQAAQQQVQNAQSQIDRVQSKTADSAVTSAAYQQVQSAKAALDRLQQPARVFDVEQADAQTKQAAAQKKQAEAGVTQAKLQKQTAELGIKQVKRRIEQATLIAPSDGVVKDLNLKLGEVVGLAPVLTLVDTGLLHIDVTVDEIDIARVRVGQEVNVTLDALPGKSYKAKVDRIAPTSRLVNGVVSYDVRVLLPPDDADLRVGMTSSASITLDKRENALTAPNWAVRRDRKAGKNYLTVREGDKSREIEVQVGLRNDQFSEILGGAEAGTLVLAPEMPATAGN